MVLLAVVSVGGLLVLSMVWILPSIHLTGADATCEFPDYLQSPDKDGELLPWNTWMWWLYLRHTPKWSEKQEVYVKGSHMWRHRDRHNLKSCDRSPRRVYSATTFGDCTERELVYNRTCITEHTSGKFRVIQYNADRTHRFTCMKFVRRSDNVVQVYEGPLSESNDEDLCDDDKMSLDEWPWVAEWHQRPYICHVNGGFTFRTIRRLTNEDLCETEWRRSHLEVECVRGDGLHFMAPSGSNCNPFLKDGDFKSLSCWAGWDEGDYIFLVAADANSPRFCLRFPKYQNGEFSTLVYFSVICPTEHDGKPPLGIEYYELRMRRKDLFSCEDENMVRCSEVLKDGGCSKHEALAKHCPRSCNLCGDKEYEESSRSRCWFDLRLYGDWVLYEADRKEEVKVDRDSLTFSLLGNFRCWKTLSETDYLYTTLSKFRNGCSPRYTCFQFKRRNNNVLQYRVGHSYREDLEADRLCAFERTATLSWTPTEAFTSRTLYWPRTCGRPTVDSTPSSPSTAPSPGRCVRGRWVTGTPRRALPVALSSSAPTRAPRSFSRKSSSACPSSRRTTSSPSSYSSPAAWTAGANSTAGLSQAT
ncbi:uncharacterized protein LOC112559332 isoform X2 [Pomacea canaliculata]|uniref:uncharacterized protein LOC112559332 isoform X2 n=1 Tax=Pomacea canaliculata TaxID=400727 RepID=UPI000D73184B|nr:uncharacterized protein LOC112559332 isoform X2 [Pomacea canaliculata]